MNSTASAISHPISSRLRHGRAINAVAEYFRRTLSVPNIYVEPKLTTTARPDLLAVDRAGAGDFHCPEFKVGMSSPPTKTLLLQMLKQVKAFPAHFRYIVVVEEASWNRLNTMPELFSSDGIGRVGVLWIDEATMAVRSVVTPERFRLSQTENDKVERFLEKAKPDIYVRI